jgi:hypothetical protein
MRGNPLQRRLALLLLEVLRIVVHIIRGILKFDLHEAFDSFIITVVWVP